MINNISYSKTKYTVLCGLFAALTVICSLIAIPLGFTPIPINLGTLAVFLAGGILGKKYGTLSIALYLLLGAAGLPVYAGFAGGLGILSGPTGGFLAGYLAATFLTGRLIEWMDKRRRTKSAENNARETALYGFFMAIGLLACYGSGIVWFMMSTGTALWAALAACVFPFLPGDALKIAAAAILTRRLRPLLGIVEVL